MQTATLFVAAALLLLLNTSCEDSSNKNVETTVADTARSNEASNSGSSGFTYDPAKDGLVTGAQFSKKLGDTLGIKFYEMTLKPGDSATLHSHPAHTVYVLQGGQLAVYFDGTNRQVMDLKPGMGFVSGPVTDAAKNIGKTTIKMLIADIYR